MGATGRQWRWHSGLLAVLAVAACTGTGTRPNADFDRHRYSQLVKPYERPDILYFDVAYPPQYPRDDLTAEDARLGWLAGWMATRKFCPAGYDVLRRRPFDYLEDNPARYAERWEVACRAEPQRAGGG